MKSRIAKLLLMLLVLNAAANVAWALFPGPFSFSFLNPGLNSLFLLPFSLVGCG